MSKVTFGAIVPTAISLAAFIMPVLVCISVVEAKPAAPVDKTGLDILCKADGGLYYPPAKGVSACLFNDGQFVTCDSKKDKCSASPTKADAKHLPTVTINEGALSLRMLKQLDDKVNALTSHIESLSAALKDRREGRNDSPAAP